MPIADQPDTAAPTLPGARPVRLPLPGGGALQGYRAGSDGPAGAPPVVLLHGVPETSLTWADSFAQLAARGPVLALDLPGLGGSDPAGDYRVPALADLLATVIRAELGAPVDLVGHDWGGILALGLAGRHGAAGSGGLVRRLVVLNAPFRRVGGRAVHVPLAALPVLPELALRAGSGWLAGAHALVRRGQVPAERLAAYTRAYRGDDRVSAMLGYYRAAVRPRFGRLLARLRPGDAPPLLDQPRPQVSRTLIVWGVDDPVLPLSVAEAAVKDIGGDVQLLSVPGAGHFVHEEAPQVVTPALLAFLDADPGAAG